MWYSIIWYEMIWYEMRWYDSTWYDVIWYDSTWYDMTWCDMCKFDALHDWESDFNLDVSKERRWSYCSSMTRTDIPYRRKTKKRPTGHVQSQLDSMRLRTKTWMQRGNSWRGRQICSHEPFQTVQMTMTGEMWCGWNMINGERTLEVQWVISDFHQDMLYTMLYCHTEWVWGPREEQSSALCLIAPASRVLSNPRTPTFLLYRPSSHLCSPLLFWPLISIHLYRVALARSTQHNTTPPLHPLNSLKASERGYEILSEQYIAVWEEANKNRVFLPSRGEGGNGAYGVCENKNEVRVGRT